MSARRYDLYSAGFKANPYPTFAAMRHEAPVWKQVGIDGETPIWFVTRHADAEAVLRDDRTFVRDSNLALPPDKQYTPSPLEALLFSNMLSVDGEAHRRLRGLVSKAFTPRRVQALRPRIQAVANELIDAAEPHGRMDLLADFAYHLPTIVIAEMLGIPTADRHRFRAWSNAVIAPALDAAGIAEFMRLMLEFKEYLDGLFAARRAQPQDDLVTDLLRVEEAGDMLSLQELYSTLVLLIVAGHETTVNLICNAILALSRNPEQRDLLLADPALLTTAVDEFVRYDGSVERALTRWVARDTVLGGQQLRRGDLIIVILGSANHDETVFDNAETLDVTRTQNRHVGFGRGAHYCLGAPLARLETEIAVGTLLARLPDLALDVPENALVWRATPGFRGLETLPVRWRAPRR